MYTATTSTNGIKQRQSERRRANLIEAATELLLDQGYEGTAVAPLALFDHRARLIDQEPSLSLLVTGLTLRDPALGHG